MATAYTVLTRDAASLDGPVYAAEAKCRALFGPEFRVFRAPRFVAGTGILRTVAEEVALLVWAQGQRAQRHTVCPCHLVPPRPLLDAAEFLDRWDFGGYQSHPLAGLSGGWRKLLSVALFSNIACPGLMFIDLTRHLSDRLIRLAVENIHTLHPAVPIVYAELDAPRLVGAGVQSSEVYDLGDRFSLSPWVLPPEAPPAETNYG
jgi:hypothetical protein